MGGSCDILMVGGGGAGGKGLGGGGGGGAVLYGRNIYIPANTYELRVGRGATSAESRDANVGITSGKQTSGFGATILGGGCAGNTGWSSYFYRAYSGGSGAGGQTSGISTLARLGGTVSISSNMGILSTATLKYFHNLIIF